MDYKELSDLRSESIKFQRDDPFYQFNQFPPTPPDTEQDWGVHDLGNDSIPQANESFLAIICVNGQPYYASIMGRINDPVVP